MIKHPILQILFTSGSHLIISLSKEKEVVKIGKMKDG